MIKAHILGCAAALPLIDRGCAGVALQVDDALYLFDAGAGVATRLMDPSIRRQYGVPKEDGTFGPDLDPYALQGIFVSHAHVDHIGDLTDLLSMLRLLAKRDTLFRFPDGDLLRVFLPVSVIGPFQTWLRATGVEQKLRYRLELTPIDAGLLYEDRQVTVEAVPSDHLGPTEPGTTCEAFSFRVQCGNRTVVYTGDLTLDNLRALLGPVDLLIAECAHLKFDDILMALRDTPPAQTVITHLSPALYGDVDRLQAELEAALGENAWIAHDGLTVDV